MQSNTNNCIVYNSIAYCGNSINYEDITLLTNLRFDNDDLIANYYQRAEKLVSKIKDIKGHTIQTWSHYKTVYIDDVLSSLRSNEPDVALSKLQNAVTSIEVELNVELWIGGIGADAYMPACQKQAKDVVIGDSCIVLEHNLNDTSQSPIIGITASRQSLVTLVSVSGVRLTCSGVTPMALEFGAYCHARDALNKNIPVIDNGEFRWEQCIEVISVGLGFVYNMQTTPNSPCYAAGDQSNRYIFTQRIHLINEI